MPIYVNRLHRRRASYQEKHRSTKFLQVNSPVCR